MFLQPDGWWNQWGTAIQAISTAILVVVTAIYVVLTNRIAKSSAAQATHARMVLNETAKGRLSILTPICSVIWRGSTMRQTDESSLGAIRMEVFDNSLVLEKIEFIIRNDGNSVTLLTVPPPAISDNELGKVPDWSKSIKDYVLIPGNDLTAEYRIEGPGRMFRRWSAERRSLTFEFDTRSPVSGVVDHHKWIGTFGAIRSQPGNEGVFDTSTEGFTGPSAATLTRNWPEDLDAT